MNNYSSVVAKVISINRHKVPELPIRYMDIFLKLEDGSLYDFSWSYSPCITTSSSSYGNKKPALFDYFWNNDAAYVCLRHKNDKAAAYIIPIK